MNPNNNTFRRDITNGATQAVKDALDDGFHPDKLHSANWTPLHVAAKADQPSIINLLVNYRYGVNNMTDSWQTPLDLARKYGKKAAVAALIGCGGKMGEEVSLHAAAYKKEASWVKRRITDGADLNALDKGMLPLCLAIRVRSGYRYLLEQGASVQLKEADGRTPLHSAAACGLVDLAKDLLVRGALVDLEDGRLDTPLCLAAKHGHAQMVDFLVANHASVLHGDESADSVYEANATPVSHALNGCYWGIANSWRGSHKDIACQLIDYGAKATFHQVIMAEHMPLVKKLLEQGADVNEVSEGRDPTPLWVALRTGNEVLVRLLLERGADPNYYKDETPLHRMVLHGEPRMIRLLLQFGADPNQKNNAGETALQHARRRGNPAIIKLLEGPASLLPPKPHAPVAGRLLTLCMAANVLSADEEFVRKLVADGKLKAVEMAPGMVRIPEDNLAAYVKGLLRV
ncbi:MAG: ankyrin repeat domain-containing protein [Verrucomicrobiota bacterium]